MIYTTPPAAIAPFFNVREAIETLYEAKQKPPIIFFAPDFDDDDTMFQIDYYATPDSEGETVERNLTDDEAQDWLRGRDDIYGYWVSWVLPHKGRRIILDSWDAQEFLYNLVRT